MILRFILLVASLVFFAVAAIEFYYGYTNMDMASILEFIIAGIFTVAGSLALLVAIFPPKV